jgi:hypothetical protein
MILLYTALLLLLGVAGFLLRRRVASLERKYSRAAAEADRFLRGPIPKEGNSGRPDPYQHAKRQYLLGVLVQKRDRLESKHDAWLAVAERFGKATQRLRGWRGKKLPYTFGVLDVSFVLYVIDYLGVGEYVSARHLVEVVTTFFARG